MAVFCTNVCKFGNCGKIFPNLSDLICHIEICHLDFDPRIVEQHEDGKVDALPLSYVLKYNQGPTNNFCELKYNVKEKYKYAKSTLNGCGSARMNNSEPIVIDSEGSEESYNIMEEITQDCIMRHSKKKGDAGPFYTKRDCNLQNKLKKFICPVPGCHKRYKNINGIKYHSKNGHDLKGNLNNRKIKREFKCHCGKGYKTAQGLKSHAMLHRDVNLDLNVYKSLMLPPPLNQPQISNYSTVNVPNFLLPSKHEFPLTKDEFLSEASTQYKYETMNYPPREYFKACTPFDEYQFNNVSLLTPNTSPNYHYTNAIFADNFALEEVINTNIPYTLTYRNL